MGGARVATRKARPKRSAKRPPKHPHVKKATKYARDVVAGRLLACKWVRLACQRHIDDLKDSKAKSYPYRFDKDAAERVCKFVELFPHVKGKWAIAKRGEPRSNLLRLEPWQCFVLCVLYGWLLKKQSEEGRSLRRFTLAYIAIPRKNSKSTMVAALALYHLSLDQEPGAEVFCGATSKDQAFEVFRPARQMALADTSAGFRRRFKVEIAAESVYKPDNGSFFKPLIGKPGDGASPSCYICDEFHEHPDATQFDTMRTGMGAREQPLAIVITTAGEDLASPCHLLQADVEKILEGTIRDGAAAETFGIIWTIDDDDDWTSDEALIKANPNYGVSVFAEQLRTLRDEALRSPRKQNVFKTKRLNVWVHARDPWMNMEAWNACGDSTLSEEDFVGEQCFIGLDLSSKLDLAGKLKVFRRDLGEDDDKVTHFYAFPRFYLPEDRAMLPELQHYQQWVHEGHLVATEGAVIDYATIEDGLRADAKLYTHSELAFDPWGATQMAQNLAADGLTTVEIPQTVKQLSEPMKEIEALVLSGRFHHPAHPVLDWCMSNVKAKEDANENIFPRKENKESKIDGATALINAMARALVAPKKKSSVYNQPGRGVRVFG